MTSARGGRRPTCLASSALALALVLVCAACAGPSPAPGSAGPASFAPAESGLPDALASPVTGRLTRIDAQGLTKVKGFTLRLEDGREVAFTLGTLENGATVPPGHLAEHMASSSAVKVFFRDVDGVLVVYRLEDGE